MERFTTETGEFICSGEHVCCADDECFCGSIEKALKKLSEYETLEDKGMLLRLPCKLGTPVYDIKWWDDKQEKVKIDGKYYYRTVHKYKVSKSKFGLFDIEDFGKTVFLTREAAEAALKEMEK